MSVLFEEIDGVRRLRALWRLIGQLALFVILSNLFAGLISAAWSLVGPAKPTVIPGAAVGNIADAYIIFGVSSLAAALSSMWLAALLLDRRPFREFGFRLSGGWFLDFLFGMGLGAALMTGIFVTELESGWVSVGDMFQAVQPGEPFFPSLVAPVILFVCVGIYEESLFRGYRIKNIAEGINFPAIGSRSAVLLSLAITSVYFGLRHAANPNADLLSTFNVFLAGILLGAGYVLTGELAIPIGLHIAWNFFQGNVYDFPVSGLNPIGATFLVTSRHGPELWTGGSFGPEGGLLLPFAAISGIVLIALWVRLRRGSDAIHDSIAEPPERVSLTRKHDRSGS